MLRRTLLLSPATVAMLCIAGCGTPPAEVDLSLAKPSAAGRYQVRLEPPAQAPRIHQMHAWTLRLATADGAAMQGAAVQVGGGMPQHGHGLPTQPHVTRELAPGTYLLEGMKFSMTGWWELQLTIDASQGRDTVTFNTIVAEATP